jgi:DNA-binding transcriptional MerR regulator
MNDESYIRFGELISKQYILPKHLGISSRQVNYWKKRAILPFFEKDKHGKMNIPQAVWLFCIKELADIGISSDKLTELAKVVWNKPREEKYADKVLIDNIKDTRNGLSENAREILSEHLENELVMGTLRTEMNKFTDMVKSCIQYPELPHAMIYTPKTKKHYFLFNNPELLIKLNSKFSDQTLVSIPILSTISKSISLDINSNQKNLEYLTSIENQIREIVVFKRPKVVEIAFDDNHIKPRIITEKHVKQDEIADFFLRNKIPLGTKLLIDVRSQDNYKLTLMTK